MLPDFPKVKEKFLRKALRAMKATVRADPLLSQIKEQRDCEGNLMESPGEPEAKPFEYVHLSASATVDRATIIARGPQKTLEDMARMAESLIEQQKQILFAAVERVADRVGNVVDAGGRPFTFDTWLELLEKVQIEFDETGAPSFPSIVLGPEMYLHVQQQIASWESNEEYSRRFAELVERKRREWSDRESYRKLVD